MTRVLVCAMLVIVGIIKFLPVFGVLGADELASLYGLDFSDPNLAILMRHRAVLFGLLGVYLLVAAFRPSLQPAAFAAGFVSVLAYLLLVWTTDGHNPQIGKIAVVDVVALVCLVIGFVAYSLSSRRAP